MGDTEMLKKILDVWVQPHVGNEEKTVGEWRKEVAHVLNEAIVYWRVTHADLPKS
jgi:hemerythrin